MSSIAGERLHQFRTRMLAYYSEMLDAALSGDGIAAQRLAHSMADADAMSLERFAHVARKRDSDHAS